MTAYDAVLKVKARRLFGNGTFAANLTIGAPYGAANANNRTSQLFAPCYDNRRGT